MSILNETFKSTSDRPSESRKVLRRSIRMAFRDSLRLRARTLDVSQSGLTVMSSQQLNKGMVCEVEFDIVLDGEVKKIIAVSRTGISVCVGEEGFRTNLRFLSVDVTGLQTINEWMNYPA